ncbi:MAG: PEP-CTERM sorting domain-containing protein [Acidobacteria bacterium]|nr:PEP-CTERM sorting domain-containing protein [Acidobacteriota bacterium]
MHRAYLLVLALVVLLAPFDRALASRFITNTPDLPPNMNHTDPLPDGTGYHNPFGSHALFNWFGTTIDLVNILHRPFYTNSIRTPQGFDEVERFDTEMIGLSLVSGQPIPLVMNGPVQVMTFGKTGNTTGTFATEMLSMDLAGSTTLGLIQIRESPTLASRGQTTITDIGGGLFAIDSFFDVFTELSLDGGLTWVPQLNGPTQVLLDTPEPATVVLSLLGLAAVWAGRRRLAA